MRPMRRNSRPNIPAGVGQHIQQTQSSSDRQKLRENLNSNKRVSSSTTPGQSAGVVGTSGDGQLANGGGRKDTPEILAKRQELQFLLDNPFSLGCPTTSDELDVRMFDERGFSQQLRRVLNQEIATQVHCCSCSLCLLLSRTQAVVNNVAEIQTSSIQSSSEMVMPQIGKPAPDFHTTAVVDGEFKPVKLADYRGKYVVLFFWPRDFTFVCPTEIIAFSDRAEEFRKINCEVIGCSTDSHFTHFAWIQQPRKQGGLGEMEIPLLADPSHQITRAYGILKEDDGLAFRGLFIIDGKGILRQITVNDLPVGRDVDETLRLVQAFQYSDAHGEVCPAGWRPGKATIKPNVKDAKSFFDKGV